ncbi:MAG: hypothetical protein KGI71_04180 [Patescibacteria group bacterium]|nr:hypothetical protein [Patescibacteria group bacterium]
MSLTIDQMQLSPVARRAARALLDAHPTVRFTSGRRDLWAQAQAMAVNTMLNRHWIGQTYLRGTTLQTWVDQQPAVVTLDQLTVGLYDQLCAWRQADLDTLSRHLGGDAFDVSPMIDEHGIPTDEGQEAIHTIMGLPGLDKFLSREGGLIRWHAQFLPSVEV